MSVKVSVVEDKDTLQKAFAIREEVFVVGQAVSWEEEFDEFEEFEDLVFSREFFMISN